jgi:RNA polymerase sigma factor (sigma-70 family)
MAKVVNQARAEPPCISSSGGFFMLVAGGVESPFVYPTQQSRNTSQFSQDVCEDILNEYETDIKRAAHSVAFGLSSTASADIAQEVRCHLYQVIKRCGNLPSPYIRRVIANAARTARLKEVRQTKNSVSLDVNADALQEQKCTPESDSDLFLRKSVAVWLRTLPKRVQQLFTLLYVEGHTQRVAALKLGITQARVAQLHSQLLQRGKLDLIHLI